MILCLEDNSVSCDPLSLLVDLRSVDDTGGVRENCPNPLLEISGDEICSPRDFSAMIQNKKSFF